MSKAVQKFLNFELSQLQNVQGVCSKQDFLILGKGWNRKGQLNASIADQLQNPVGSTLGTVEGHEEHTRVQNQQHDHMIAYMLAIGNWFVVWFGSRHFQKER